MLASRRSVRRFVVVGLLLSVAGCSSEPPPTPPPTEAVKNSHMEAYKQQQEAMQKAKGRRR